MPFNFVSQGAAVQDALKQYLVQREMERRQTMFDNLKIQEANDAQVDRRRNRTRQDEADARQTKVETQQDADRMARVIGPDADLTNNSDAIKTFEAGGYGVEKPTLGAKTLDMTTMPGQVDASAGSKLPGIVMPSQQHRAETAPETQARKVREDADHERQIDREARAALAKDAAEARRQQNADSIASREGIAQLSAQQRANEAAARLANAQTSQEIAQARLELQQSLAALKIDATHKTQTDAASGVATTRGNIRALAVGLMDDPSLPAIAGALDSRTPDLLPGSVDAARRLRQLQDLLSVDARKQLKGQGAVSDFETRMLVGSTSALDRAAGATLTRQHLQEIAKAFEGDTPNQGAANSHQTPGAETPEARRARLRGYLPPR